MHISMEDIYNTNPGAIFIKCCGFDLQRKSNNACAEQGKLALLWAFSQDRIFVANKNLYFVWPGLSKHVAILMLFAYGSNTQVVVVLDSLVYLP